MNVKHLLILKFRYRDERVFCNVDTDDFKDVKEFYHLVLTKLGVTFEKAFSITLKHAHLELQLANSSDVFTWKRYLEFPDNYVNKAFTEVTVHECIPGYALNIDGDVIYKGKAEVNIHKEKKKDDESTDRSKFEENMSSRMDQLDAKFHGLETALRDIQEDSSTVHNGVFCDVCNPDSNDNPIKGVRYHCLDCIDFDLCTTCYVKGGDSGNHKSSHKFEKIKEPRINPFSQNGDDLIMDLTFQNPEARQLLVNVIQEFNSLKKLNELKQILDDYKSFESLMPDDVTNKSDFIKSAIIEKINKTDNDQKEVPTSENQGCIEDDDIPKYEEIENETIDKDYKALLKSSSSHSNELNSKIEASLRTLEASHEKVQASEHIFPKLDDKLVNHVKELNTTLQSTVCSLKEKNNLIDSTSDSGTDDYGNDSDDSSISFEYLSDNDELVKL